MSLSEKWVVADAPSSAETVFLQQTILGRFTSEASRTAVGNAIVFATAAHDSQKRHSGEPQMVHPLRAMEQALFFCDSLPQEGQVRLLQVIALHDVIEDTAVSQEAIETFFGPDIALAVGCLSKKQRGKLRREYAGEDKVYFQTLRSLAEETEDTLPPDIKMLIFCAKVADRIENILTLSTLAKPDASPEEMHRKQKEYIAETREYIIPLLREGHPLRITLLEAVLMQEQILGLAAREM